jgi:phosphoenolpyruvate carboxykinase (GTP)
MPVAPALAKAGWKVWTPKSATIAWLRPATTGRLWAVNPEAGFGVAPAIQREDQLQRQRPRHNPAGFTNVALASTGPPWWEGFGRSEPPADPIPLEAGNPPGTG